MSTAQQLDLIDALNRREAAMRWVEQNADATYRDRLIAAIEQLAATGRNFCADEVRYLAGEPPEGQHYNVIGAVINHAARRGVIEFVGFTRSMRVIGHGNRIGLYRGAAA